MLGTSLSIPDFCKGLMNYYYQHNVSCSRIIFAGLEKIMIKKSQFVF